MRTIINATVAIGFIAFWNSLAHAADFYSRLSGFDVTGGLNSESGAILTNGVGTLQLNLNEYSQTASYTLTFANLARPLLWRTSTSGKRACLVALWFGSAKPPRSRARLRPLHFAQ